MPPNHSLTASRSLKYRDTPAFARLNAQDRHTADKILEQAEKDILAHLQSLDGDHLSAASLQVPSWCYTDKTRDINLNLAVIAELLKFIKAWQDAEDGDDGRDTAGARLESGDDYTDTIAPTTAIDSITGPSTPKQRYGNLSLLSDFHTNETGDHRDSHSRPTGKAFTVRRRLDFEPVSPARPRFGKSWKQGSYADREQARKARMMDAFWEAGEDATGSE